MTGIAPIIIEPRIVIKNHTPLLEEALKDFYYLASLVKAQDFILSLVISHKEGKVAPTVRSQVIPAEQEKLANDSIINTAKTLRSKEIDILAFEPKKTMNKDELQDYITKWITETATTP